MGLTPGSDFETGIPCPACFDPDNPIGQQETPKFVQVVASDIIACPARRAPPNGTFLLTQFAACLWTAVINNFNISYASSVLFGGELISQLDIFDLTEVAFSFRSRSTECATFFESRFDVGDCGGGISAHNGEAVVSWGPGIGP